MHRKMAVFDKLIFASEQNDILLNEVFSEALEGTRIKDFENRAANIVQDYQKTFDYCANDVVDVWIRPILPTSHAVFRNKIYFPFYFTQTSKSTWFSYLEALNIDLFSYMKSISDHIETDDVVPVTNIKYSAYIHLKEFGNIDKHDKPHIFKSFENVNMFVEDRSGAKYMFNPTFWSNAEAIQVDSNSRKTLGKRYFVDQNAKEVLHFLMECRTITKITMENIYDLL